MKTRGRHSSFCPYRALRLTAPSRVFQLLGWNGGVGCFHPRSGVRTRGTVSLPARWGTKATRCVPRALQPRRAGSPAAAGLGFAARPPPVGAPLPFRHRNLRVFPALPLAGQAAGCPPRPPQRSRSGPRVSPWAQGDTPLNFAPPLLLPRGFTPPTPRLPPGLRQHLQRPPRPPNRAPAGRRSPRRRPPPLSPPAARGARAAPHASRRVTAARPLQGILRPALTSPPRRAARRRPRPRRPPCWGVCAGERRAAPPPPAGSSPSPAPPPRSMGSSSRPVAAAHRL